jgi:cytochrome c peroxidase
MRRHSSLLILGGCTVLLCLAGAARAQTWEALPAVAPAPADNPTTAAKVELGKMLYHDPRFSETGTVSCASCHNVMEGGDDHRPTSVGVHGVLGGRNAPTVYNAAFLSSQFWDGRAATLEDQAKGPITNPIEMGMKDLPSAMARIRAIPGYAPYFAAAFGSEGDVMTIDNAARAIAAYERTLITPNSAYDRYVQGDRQALNAQQLRGMELFASVGCQACHAGAAFAGPPAKLGEPVLQRFPVIAASPYVAKYALAADKGRAVSTGQAADEHLWRVPTLRNLQYTAPYMHNGSVKTVVDAARVMASTQLSRELEPAQAEDLGAFLFALTGEFPPQTMPRLPPTPGDLLL